jgi:8-oxoguanine deaminase
MTAPIAASFYPFHSHQDLYVHCGEEMTRTLIKNARCILTMDDDGRELANAHIVIRDGWIESVGTGSPPNAEFDETLDASAMLVLPGFVNVHHHLYQTLTRGYPESNGQPLFPWLKSLYPVWARLDEESVFTSTQVGLAELLLSGCTTSSDHLYVFPRGHPTLLDVEIEAAQKIGARFHVCRGSMDLSVENGGLPPSSIVQHTDEILQDCERVIAAYHDPTPGAMVRVALAPCSPFSVSRRLMEESATLARARGVRLHTHIAETLDEERYCQEVYNSRPVELLERMGWLGPDVWLAHCVHLDRADIERLAQTGTGVAHCPTSNMLLGSGLAPLVELLAKEVAVGLGVDGSASNDSGYFVGEIKQALLAARVRTGATALTARVALRLATRGGAACLGRDDIGQLAAGKVADIALFPIDGLLYAGAQRDLVGAFVLCGPARAAHVLVGGKRVVCDGHLTMVDELDLAARHNRAAARLLT